MQRNDLTPRDYAEELLNEVITPLSISVPVSPYENETGVYNRSQMVDMFMLGYNCRCGREEN